MIDSNNVLLLRPTSPGSGFAPESARGGLIVAMVHAVGVGGEEAFTEFFARTLEPALTLAGSTVLATFVSEHAANTYPALPIREGENVFVWFARFVDSAALERYRQAVETSDSRQRPSEVLLLAPTPRSKLQ